MPEPTQTPAPRTVTTPSSAPRSTATGSRPARREGEGAGDVRRVLCFFLIAFALTWWVVPLGSDAFPVFPYGPDAALVVVVSLGAGRAGLRKLVASLRRRRASLGWYAFALLVPPALGLAAVAATRAAGAPASAAPGPGSLLEFVLILPVMVMVGGALGEELGWRGYALPLLQRRLSPLSAVGVVFLAHALWHLPLFFTDDPPAPVPFLIELGAGGVVLAWLMNSTRVVWLPILLHGAHNMTQQAFMSRFSGADLVILQWLTAAAWASLAAIVVLTTGGRLVARASGPLTTPLHEIQSASGEEQGR